MPLLSIWEVSGSQLKFISLGLTHRLTNDYDDHNEDGQQDQYATNGDRNHGAITHKTVAQQKNY